MQDLSDKLLAGYYSRYEAAKRAIGIANKLGKKEKSTAMRLFNKHAWALRHIQRGTRPPKRFNPQCYATVLRGLKVGIVYDYDGDDLTDVLLIDRGGYRFHIDHKLSSADWDSVHEACYADIENERTEHKIGLFLDSQGE